MPVLIPVKKLQAISDPYRACPWMFWFRLTRKAVRQSIRDKRFIANPHDNTGSSEDHVARIAYLVKNGWDDAVVMDVGIPKLQCYVEYPLLDGNHRLAAAIYRKDEVILASVSGSIDYAFELFGVDVTEPTAKNSISVHGTS